VSGLTGRRSLHAAKARISFPAAVKHAETRKGREHDMTRTKLLLTGLLAGAVAFGTACKTDKAAAGTSTDTTPMGMDAGTGGAGMDDTDRTRQGTNPVPEEGVREQEPGVHEGSHDMPGTGGTGLEDEPMDESDNLTGEDPLNPGSPTTEPLPNDEGLLDDEGTGDQHRE
jgi:hypothetical protein